MGQEPEFEENCERYLLGELSGAEREQFEEAYFADDALFERFQAVKDELLDAYARGELPEEKKARFAAHFLAPAANRRELDETREFIRAVTAVSAKKTGDAAVSAPAAINTSESWRKSFKGFFNLRPFAWQAAFAAVLLVALAGAWIFVRNWQQGAPADQTAVQPTPLLPTTPAPPIENQNTPTVNSNTDKTPGPTPGSVNKPPANVNQLPANVNRSPAGNANTTPQAAPEKTPVRTPQNLPAQVASVVLLPVATRSISDSNTLRLDSSTRTVNIRLVFKSENYPGYEVTIATVGGAVVQQRKMPGGKAVKSVSLQVAAALLRHQDYIVTLKGTTPDGQTETIGEYYFRVERRPK